MIMIMTMGACVWMKQINNVNMISMNGKLLIWCKINNWDTITWQEQQKKKSKQSADIAEEKTKKGAFTPG